VIGRGFWLLLGRGDGDEAVKRGETTGFIGVDTVVTDGLLALGRKVVDGGGDEVGGFEYLEVAFDVVVTLGAVNDGFGGGVPGDFLEGEGMAQQILGKAFASSCVVRGDGFFATIVDVEAGVFPYEELVKLPRADKFGIAQAVEEAVTKKLYGWGEALIRHAMEGSVRGEESVGCENVKVGVKNEVVAKGVDGGNGTDASVGKIESCAEGILEGGCGCMEKVGEQVASLTENATQDSGDGEHELPVRDIMADTCGDPAAGTADATLVAGGAEVAALACEGE